MNVSQIEELKAILTRSTQRGCRVQCSSPYAVQGRLVGIGFRPYWSNPMDSRIDKLEFNYMDDYGSLRHFFLNNVIGYEITSQEGDSILDSSSVGLDIHAYSPTKVQSSEPYDKIHIELIKI